MIAFRKLARYEGNARMAAIGAELAAGLKTGTMLEENVPTFLYGLVEGLRDLVLTGLVVPPALRELLSLLSIKLVDPSGDELE